MNLKDYLSITPEVSAALRDGKPVVALESTILSHGMPYPENLAFAAEIEKLSAPKAQCLPPSLLSTAC